MTIKTRLGAQRYNNRMGKIWEKAKEAQSTIHYRYMEFQALDTSKSEYLPSIQIFDGKGERTKTLAITFAELEQIREVLTGSYKPETK